MEKAGAVLDQILEREEKKVDLTAANHYNRALAFELQFRPLDALPHLEKAYQYRPEELKYGQAYSHLLLGQNDFVSAEPILLATLDRAREQAKANSAYQPDVAESLNNLATLYADMHRLKEAEAAWRESLRHCRQLAKTGSATYQPLRPRY